MYCLLRYPHKDLCLFVSVILTSQFRFSRNCEICVLRIAIVVGVCVEVVVVTCVALLTFSRFNNDSLYDLWMFNVYFTVHLHNSFLLMAF